MTLRMKTDPAVTPKVSLANNQTVATYRDDHDVVHAVRLREGNHPWDYVQVCTNAWVEVSSPRIERSGVITCLECIAEEEP